MTELTHVSLFSGIGGLDLAAEAAGFRTVCQCEWADYPYSVLKSTGRRCRDYRDITTFTKEAFFEKTELKPFNRYIRRISLPALLHRRAAKGLCG